MGLRITGTQTLESNVAKARRDYESSLERLSSGVKFTKSDPQPADRALSDGMQRKVREMAAYKRNANEGISLVQTAEDSLNEISNIGIRLKELATQAANPTLSDKERKFLFVEYHSLYNEAERIAETTKYNGIPLLMAGDDRDISSRGLSFRISAPQESGDDFGLVSLTGIEDVIASPLALGIKSVENLIFNSDGVSLDDIDDLFDNGIEFLGESFDAALTTISEYRANFGAIGARLNRAIDAIDVGMENLSAATSRIRDVDYASEVANLTSASLLMQTGVSVLSQSYAAPAQAILTLLKNID